MEAGNPLAARLRLGLEIRRRRKDLGLNERELGMLADITQSGVSRLEHPLERPARRTSLGAVTLVLDALGLLHGSPERRELEQLAKRGNRKGWWPVGDNPAMGERQRRTAIVEADAATIVEYATFLPPGLLQTEEFARHRARVGAYEQDVDVEAIVVARMTRQRHAFNRDVAYRVVLEPQAVARRQAPPHVALDQLHHMLQAMERPNVGVRILPVDADSGDAGAVASSPFACFAYPDPGDPQLAIVYTREDDQVLTDTVEVSGYARLHDKLYEVAMPAAESAAFIRDVASRLEEKIKKGPARVREHD